MWSLQKNEKQLEPLVFSNGKSQIDIVRETLDAIKEGYKIIFIKGMCGTGKSAIALNLARNLGKTSIVVPIKSLQEQYTKDYTNDMYVLNKSNNEKLKISSLFGRKNFPCKYLEQNTLPEKTYREKDSKLSDIFNSSTKPLNSQNNKTCDNPDLPCKIEIKEKNILKLKQYLKQNSDVKITDFSNVNEIKRMSIASVCPYWCPIIPSEIEVHKFNGANKIKYKGLNNKEFIIYQRKQGCHFYDQYPAYKNSDVLIFNSQKYKLETLMDRKPATEIEVIDECDEFLDSFANIEKISLNKLLFALGFLFAEKPEADKIIKEIEDITNTLKRKFQPSQEIIAIKDTLVEELIKTTLRNQNLLDEVEIDENNYFNHLDHVARTFISFLDETYFSVEKIDNDLTISIVTTNLEKRFKELVEKNRVLVMMSGTIHAESILRTIFGLEEFKIIDAEVKNQGELIPCRHGQEIDCKYANFNSGKISREQFLKAFSKTIECAKTPTLVHLTSFSDLPTDLEKQKLELRNLPSQSQLIHEQSNDPMGQRIKDFKNKQTKILFTTKCNRGIDFPGDVCNSIVLSRFPYPNISSIFWKVLKKTNPQNFMPFYMDKSKRELLQKVYRGLRSKTDRVYLLSPDKRVLDFNWG